MDYEAFATAFGITIGILTPACIFVILIMFAIGLYISIDAYVLWTEKMRKAPPYDKVAVSKDFTTGGYHLKLIKKDKVIHREFLSSQELRR